MKRKNIFIFIILAGLAGAILNLDTSITCGVNGHYSEIHMPLYVKWIEFLGRHYEYKRMAKAITAGCKNDEERVLALLGWVHQNIKDTPQGMPSFDDHVLNIIIRRYGVPEQFQDVFATLSSYSGSPAFWQRIYDKDHRARYPLSFVNMHGKWRVFDAYRGKFFRANAGDIASVEDIMHDRSLIKGDDVDAIVYRGVPYKEFYYNLQPLTQPTTLRAEKQMPLKRIVFEIKKILGIEKKTDECLNFGGPRDRYE